MNIIKANQKIKCYTKQCKNPANIRILTDIQNGDIFFCFDCYNIYKNILYEGYEKYEKLYK